MILLHHKIIKEMKKIYTALVALGLALGANAQSNYKLDSSFNAIGSKIYTTEFPNAHLRACYLNNDGTMIVAGSDGPSNYDQRYVARINANGSIDPSLCNNICIDSGGVSFYTNIYKLNNDFYISSTGYGGDVLYNNANSIESQVFDKNEKKSGANIQFNANHIIEGISGQGEIYAYNANTAGVGYAGAAGIINGASNPHGGTIPPISGVLGNGIDMNVLGVQSNKSILAAGGMYVLSTSQTEPFIARYKPNSLITDSTFGTNGIVKLSSQTGVVTAMEIAADNNIYVCYTAGSNSYLAILNANGTIKTSANSGGIISLGTPVYNMFLTKQNRLLIAKSGNASNAKIIGKNLDGYDDNIYNGSHEILLANLNPDFTYFNVNDIADDAYGNLAISGYANTSSNTNWLGSIIRLKSLNPVVPTAIANSAIISSTMYPNPATSQITVEDIVPNSEIAITNISGQKMRVDFVNKNTLNIEMYPAGLYFIQINNGGITVKGKFSKL